MHTDNFNILMTNVGLITTVDVQLCPVSNNMIVVYWSLMAGLLRLVE